jgi:hypothetical protein
VPQVLEIQAPQDPQEVQALWEAQGLLAPQVLWEALDLLGLRGQQVLLDR